MLNHAPRNCNPVNSQTPAVVGPTTYVICDKRDRLVNHVPFLSSEKKVTKFFSPATCHALYDVSTVPRKIPGGSTLQNRSIRFAFKESDTPSPAEYDPKIQGKCKRLDPTPIEGKGKLYFCRVPYSVRDCGPSIPTEINENGYYADEYGDVVKIPPNEHDRTIGPAFYRVNYSQLCQQYRGCKWSKSTTKRGVYKMDNFPGPGAYDPQFPKCKLNPEEEEYRQMARLYSFLPRYIEGQQLKFLREGLPGPADYDVRNCTICTLCPGIKRKPFISKSKRFKRILSDNPAPGEYEMVDAEHTVSRKHIPFFVQSSRFSTKAAARTPGPGDYEIKAPITEKLESKKNKFVSIEPPFNKTSPRTTTPIKKDAAFTPSPAEYILDAAKMHCKVPPTSMFKSKVRRFTKLCKKERRGHVAYLADCFVTSCQVTRRNFALMANQTNLAYILNDISPAHYDINDSYNFSRNQQSHNAYEIAFNALAARKGILSHIKEGPGPADYLKQGNLSTHGQFFAISPRFDDGDTDTPGPGTYHIHPSFGTSTHKAYKSHNLHITECVLKKKLRRHPNETYAKWAAGLSKKKKLKWFVNEGKNFHHC